jgi:D-alanyl-D-alanine carboxypeptidase
MATRSYWLPVAGEVTNTNALLGHDGFVGMKTGSDAAAGGCLMFRVVWPTRRGNRSLIGVVLGQRGDDLLTAGLSAAMQLVDRLAPNAAAPDASSVPGIAERQSAAQPGLAPPDGDRRRHTEIRVRAGRLPRLGP